MFHVTLKFKGGSKFSMTVCRDQKIMLRLFLFLSHFCLMFSNCIWYPPSIWLWPQLKAFHQKPILLSSWTQCDMTFPGPYCSWTWHVIEPWPMECKQKCGCHFWPRLLRRCAPPHTLHSLLSCPPSVWRKITRKPSGNGSTTSCKGPWLLDPQKRKASRWLVIPTRTIKAAKK